MTIQYATERLIDSVWTMEFKIVDGKAEILSFNRTNKKGNDEETQLPQLRVHEDEKRIVRKITIAPFEHYRKDFSDGQVLEVLNPKHIFSYE